MKIKHCRSCKNIKLTKVYSLGKQSLTGIFPSKKNSKVTVGQLSMVLCNKCKLLQLENNFNPHEMYGDNYGYRSSLNNSMVSHLKLKSKKLTSEYKFNINDNILDIGSNDGTFLSFFSKKFNLYGCDPTIKKFSKYYRKDIKQIQDFFSSKFFVNKKFKLITTISMFYDLPDPLKFAKEINSILAKDGIWHIELSYMPMMIKNISYDTICHEHLEYYSLHSLKYLLDKAGLKIINLSFNQTNGGSITLDVSKKSSKYKKCSYLISWILQSEKLNRYNTIKKQKEFFKACKTHKILLKKLIKNLQEEGKTIYGYGASTKGNVLLQYFDLDKKQISYIADRNPKKFGLFTPGTRIPIISEKKSRATKPDYYLVLPWHFKNEILKRESKMLDKGTSFIFPLPKFSIVKKR